MGDPGPWAPASETIKPPPAATRDPCLGSLLSDKAERDANLL